MTATLEDDELELLEDDELDRDDALSEADAESDAAALGAALSDAMVSSSEAASDVEDEPELAVSDLAVGKPWTTGRP